VQEATTQKHSFENIQFEIESAPKWLVLKLYNYLCYPKLIISILSYLVKSQPDTRKWGHAVMPSWQFRNRYIFDVYYG